MPEPTERIGPVASPGADLGVRNGGSAQSRTGVPLTVCGACLLQTGVRRQSTSRCSPGPCHAGWHCSCRARPAPALHGVNEGAGGREPPVHGQRARSPAPPAPRSRGPSQLLLHLELGSSPGNQAPSVVSGRLAPRNFWLSRLYALNRRPGSTGSFRCDLLSLVAFSSCVL